MDIICVHGWGHNGAIWDDLAPMLDGWVRRVDLGFVKGAEDLAEPELPELYGALYIGHSLGAMWLLPRIASLNPAGFVSIGGFDHFLHANDAKTPTVLKAMKAGLKRRPYQQMRDFWQAAGTPDYAQESQLNFSNLMEGLKLLESGAESASLKALCCPVLALAGSEDKIVPKRMSRKIWEDFDLRILEGGDHTLPFSAPEWCALQINDFIEGLYD